MTIKNKNNCIEFMVYSIKLVYRELDFASFLLSQRIIESVQYKQSLMSMDSLELIYILQSNEQKNLIFEEFQKRILFQKMKYESNQFEICLGRIGELLNFIIFSEKTRKSHYIFKKTTSSIFSPGIDYFTIKYDHKRKCFTYFFFEVKTTIKNISEQKYKVQNWYKLDNFTGKYLDELELLKFEVNRNNRLTTSEKNQILNDLDALATDLIFERKPHNIFYFCSTFFFEKGFVNENSYVIEKAEQLANGFDNFFQILDFSRKIRRAYRCLGISLKK